MVRASVEERNIDFILKDNGVYVASEEKKGKAAPKKKGAPGKGAKVADKVLGKKEAKPAAKRKGVTTKDAAKKKSGEKTKIGAKAKAPKGVKEKTDAKKAKPTKQMKTAKKTEKPAKARRRAARAAKKDDLPNSAVWPDSKSKRKKQ